MNKKILFYSSVSTKELFSKVGFYRDDIEALSLKGDRVFVSNSLMEIFRIKPTLIVSYFYSKSIFAAIYGRITRTEVILTGGADQISPALKLGLILFVHRALAFLCLIFANRILLSCSDDFLNFKKLCMGLKYLENKIELVNHVVVPSPITNKQKKINNGEFNAFTICWMGSVDNVVRKGVDKSIILIARLRHMNVSASLKIAGTDGPGKKYLEDLAFKLNVADHIIFLGTISEGEKNIRFAEDDAYLQLSIHEGFGVAAAEAFFSGMIVVHSNRGGLKDVIGKNGLILDPEVVSSDDLSPVCHFYEKVKKFNVDKSVLDKLIGAYSIENRSCHFLKNNN